MDSERKSRTFGRSEDPEAAGPPGARASGPLAAGCPENEKVKVKLAELVNNTENS